MDAEDRWQLSMMSSRAARAELERLQILAQREDGTSLYLDRYLKFLTMVHRLYPPPPPRESVPYPNPKL